MTDIRQSLTILRALAETAESARHSELAVLRALAAVPGLGAEARAEFDRCRTAVAERAEIYRRAGGYATEQLGLLPSAEAR